MSRPEGKSVRKKTASSRTGHVLRVQRPSGAQHVHGLGASAVRIGRGDANTIVLDEALVSRMHARIEPVERGYVLKDLRSKNGTLVNGEPADGHLLKEGDVIAIGDSTLVFDAAQREQRTDTSTQDELAVEVSTPDLDTPELDIEGLEALQHIADLLTDADCELGSLEEVTLYLRAVVPCERATVIIVEEGTQKPLMRFSRSRASGVTEGPEDQIVKAGLTAAQPVALNVPKASAVLDATLGVNRHVLLVPLIVQDRKLGLIALEREPADPSFEKEDVRLASIVGSHIATFLRFVV